MFFDEKLPPDSSRNTMLAIAREQKKLFHLATADPSAENERNRLRSVLQTTWRGRKAGALYWWNIPWQDISEALLRDTVLGSYPEEGGWEWERQVICEEKNGLQALFIVEEGRKAGVAILEDSWTSGVRSPYSDEDQQKILDDYECSRSSRELWELIGSGDDAIYSEASGRLYGNMAEYQASAEYMLNRMDEKNRLRESLFVNYEKHTQRMATANKHFKRVVGIAFFHIASDGLLEMVKPADFVDVLSEGEKPEECCSYDVQNSAIFCADYIAEHHLARKASLNLFCKDEEKGASSYKEALQQAEIFTCLADMLI